jgi:peptidoglycan-N-acetylglucosamine deacetylase
MPKPEDGALSTSGEMLHALSFDVEDWFHILEAKGANDPNQWPKLHEQSIVERCTDLILRICAEHRTQATFFILGWIAERHPALVRRIRDEGHEIGTHSFWHRKVYELDPAEFKRDIDLSIQAIQAAAPGAHVAGFRAPSFSIIHGAEWAFDVLLDCGIRYDSSLFPAARGHGGYVCQLGPHMRVTPQGRRLAELPMSVASVGYGPLRRRMCYSGGGYLRLLPSALIHQGMAIEAKHGRASIVYLHPRDFAPDAPRLHMPLHRRFKCYVGLDSTEPKLRRLLQTYRWAPCQQILDGAIEQSLGLPVQTPLEPDAAAYVVRDLVAGPHTGLAPAE